MSGASGNLAAALVITSGISDAGDAYTQAQATRAQGAYQAGIYEQNARTLNAQANDAVTRGGRMVARVRQDQQKMIAGQRVGFAGQGVEVNTGSAADVQQETKAISSEDAITIKNNSWLEAFGFKSQALDQQTRANMARTGSKYQSRSMLLTGGSKLVGSFARAAYYKNDAKSAAPGTI